MDDIADPRFIRQPEPEAAPEEGSETIDLGDLDLVKLKPDALVIDLPDGSISINFGGLGLPPVGAASDHDANLAEHVGSGSLASVADDLIRLITDDITRQEARLADTVKGLDLLGIKLEEPKSEPNSEGMSVIKHPLLLEAVLRFQANARGELLPVDGPVKVANDGDGGENLDLAAKQLEDDMNHYLTATATEYYPDTDRMFFSLGLNGECYRKVYFHPLKRRPVVETIDRKDIILSEGSVSLEACGRVTHRSRMRPSIVKQMQLAGVWRDANTYSGIVSPDLNQVDRKIDDLAGMSPKSLTVGLEEQDREIYECYCELDLAGFEHKEDDEETGLPLPYRVTIDKESRQILEIRRWWEEGDPSYVRKEVFVEYVFVPAFPGLNLGLLHILGNCSRALTSAWRIALDNGMLANFPGGVMARSTGKQQTTNIRVGPGQVAPIDVDGVPLNQAFMPLPYRDVTAGFLQMIQGVEQTAKNLGGTAETAVGEGRQDAPVGTTIALIEQATKILNAVHKRMHQAQQKEFMLLRDIFRRDPKPLERSAKNPNYWQDAAQLQEALDNNDIVPKADPNTSSQSMRIQKAIAVYTLAQQNPSAFDQQAVYRRILSMIGIEDADSLFNKAPPAPPQIDEAKLISAKASMVSAQAKMMDTSIKAQTQAGEMGLGAAKTQTEHVKTQADLTKAKFDMANTVAERKGKLQLEGMKIAQASIVHGEKLGHEKEMSAQDMALKQQEHQADLAHKQQEHNMNMQHEQKIKGLDLQHAMQQKSMDLDHQREQNAMNMAQTENQSAAQRLHEVSLANKKSQDARESQFMDHTNQQKLAAQKPKPTKGPSK